MSDEVMLQEAIDAIQQKQLERARDLLTRLIRNKPNRADYWLWMSATVPTRKEKIYCLKNALRLDPNNETAKHGLVFFGAMQADPNIKPLSLVTRKWKVNYGLEGEQPGLGGILRKSAARIALFVLLSILVIGTILAAVFIPQRQSLPAFTRPTKTFGAAPSFTYTPTYIGYVGEPTSGTPQPTVGKPPLWTFLKATYTPTPIYVNTPHAITEAFSAGQLAFSKGHLNEALSYFEQAIKMEPQAADIRTMIADIYRLKGDNKQALASYNLAIQIDNQFAPAYLGRALLNRASNPRTDISADINQAIKLDPNLVEAYLVRAEMLAAKQDFTEAEQALQEAARILPFSPLPHLGKAEIALANQDYKLALEQATIAHELDLTLLSAYRVLGEASLMTDDYSTAGEKLIIYLDYEPQDLAAWVLLGRAQAKFGTIEEVQDALLDTDTEADYKTALESFNKAETDNQSEEDLFLYRGIINLANGEGQAAVNDFLAAQQYILSQSSSGSPLRFSFNIGLSRALLSAGRLESALDQINYAANLAQTEEQDAAASYWRAVIYEQMDKSNLARRDWQILLDLPETAVNDRWLTTAESRIATLSAPTITLTPTKTRTPRHSQTPTRTLKSSPTPQPTKSFTPTT